MAARGADAFADEEFETGSGFITNNTPAPVDYYTGSVQIG
jgi:hypothetical protein